jgi:hypothetical protein
MPKPRRLTVANLLFLLAGLATGWTLASTRTPALRAQGGDRWEESILTAGPTFIRYDRGSEVQVAQDAIYYLDYRRGTLVGTIPTSKQTAAGSSMIEGFAERDLVADFRIDVDNGPTPHFLMTTGSVYQGSGSAFGTGWAPLFVFETTTRQVAAYKIEQKQIGTSNQIRFELVELKPFGRTPAAPR